MHKWVNKSVIIWLNDHLGWKTYPDKMFVCAVEDGSWLLCGEEERKEEDREEEESSLCQF